MTERVYKSYIPTIIMFMVGFIITIEFFFNVPESMITAAANIKNISMVIAAFALGVGGVNIAIVHGNRIRRRVSGEWYFSIWLIVLFITHLVVGLALETTSPQYTWLFNSFYVPINMTLYALIGFYVIYACYNSLRVRSPEAIVMVVVTCLTILGRAPIGETIWPGFLVIQNWLKSVPNTGASRAITIVGSIGAILIGIRTLIGIEKGAMGESE